MKKILCLLFGTTMTTTFVVGPAMEISELLPKNNYESEFNLDNFDNINVTNDELIKGVDVSSYAEVLEGYLFQNNIFKSSNTDEKILKYSYKDFESTYKYDQSKTIQEYLDDSVYSYINNDGERIYENMFKILKSQGVNSIRLRLWVDPTDGNGNSYGGGHNDLDTDIYIIKQAQKYGINNYVIDFHYSDFWADPNRQYLPKSWNNLSESQLNDKVFNYTYDVLEAIYAETKTMPYSVQIGNEITRGMMWDEEINNFDDSINYIVSGCEAVLSAQNDILNKSNCNYDSNYKIKKIIHIESPGKSRYYKSLKNYMYSKKLYELIDVIGITFYPSWQGTPEKMFSILRELKFNYPEKEIQIMEFSLPYTLIESGNLGDSPSVGMDYKKSFPNSSPADQIVLLYDYMLAMSRALPDQSIGFYWWEPGWIPSGDSTWATKTGIEYASNYDKDKIKNNTPHISWSNQGLFDENGLLLPVAEVLNQFDRINSNGNSVSSKNDYKNNFYDSEKILSHNVEYYNDGDQISFDKSLFIKKEKIPFIKNYKKKNISSYLYDVNNKWNDELYVYDDNLNSSDIKKKIFTDLQSQYRQIMFNQLDVDIDLENNVVNLSASENSLFYYGTQSIKLYLQNYNQNNIKMKNTLQISKDDQNWEDKILSFIKNDPNYSDSLFWNQLDISGGISKGDNNKHNVWLYDSSKKKNRYADYYFLDDGNVFYSQKDKLSVNSSKNSLADYQKIKDKKKNWPSKIGDILNKDNKIYFTISKKIDSYSFMNYGSESWQKIGLMIFEIDIKTL